MAAAILWIATGNAHYQTPHTDHQALRCLVSPSAPWRHQYQLYAPTVSCNPSWLHLPICVKEQSTLWPLVSYTALCKSVTWCDKKLNSSAMCSSTSTQSFFWITTEVTTRLRTHLLTNQYQHEWCSRALLIPMAKHMLYIVQEGLSNSEIQHLDHNSTVQKCCINQRRCFWYCCLYSSARQYICLWTKRPLASQWQWWWASMISWPKNWSKSPSVAWQDRYNRENKLQSLFIDRSCSFPFVGSFTAGWKTGSLFLDKGSLTLSLSLLVRLRDPRCGGLHESSPTFDRRSNGSVTGITNVDNPPSTNLLYWSWTMHGFTFPYGSINWLHDIFGV